MSEDDDNESDKTQEDRDGCESHECCPRIIQPPDVGFTKLEDTARLSVEGSPDSNDLQCRISPYFVLQFILNILGEQSLICVVYEGEWLIGLLQNKVNIRATKAKEVGFFLSMV